MSKKSTKPAGANIFAGAIEGLGDSVSAFFTDDEAQQFPVALDLIDMRPQIRTELEDEDNPLPELAASIKAVGVISPIFLRRKGERYELIAGERRVRAAQMAGLDAIPAMVRDLTDQQAEDIQAAENIQRKNLTNMELARRLQKDLEQLGSIDAVMAKRNKSRSWVSKILSLNKLPEQTQRLVTEGVTADLAIISDVRQIEARDPFVAKELVDDLKRNFGKGDSREKVQRVRARIKPAANTERSTVAEGLGR
jgi:ParB family chromosome partitioning protein